MARWVRPSLRATLAGLWRHLLPLLLAAGLGLPLRASAETPAGPEIVSEQHDGVDGAFVPDTILRQVMMDRSELEASRDKLAALATEVDELQARADLLADAAEKRGAQAKALDQALASERRLRAAAEKDRDAWYRSPVFLVVMGVLGTGLIEVGALALGNDL